MISFSVNEAISAKYGMQMNIYLEKNVVNPLKIVPVPAHDRQAGTKTSRTY